ncbi:amino acid ABC transporter ATP-binding/permease protein [Glutamicibacter uratoxydans]|uniref:amino acid ABC transporter ATP-binding/permease protein n=1 Tax=Glutamicibacter uratoxydans TaxID=43667 RepID=UPI003D700981
MSTEKHTSSRSAALRWIISCTRDLLARLLLAAFLACGTRLASLGIYYVAALGLLRAAGLDLSLPGAQLDYPALAGCLVGLALAKGGLRYAEQFVGHRVAFLALARLRTQIYADYERQAPFAVGSHSGAMLQRAVRDIDRVEVFFAHTLPPAVAAVVVSGSIGLWVCLSVDLGSGLILLAGYLLLGLVIPLLGLRTLQRATQAETGARRAASAVIADTLAGAEVVFSLNAQRALASRLHNTHQDPNVARAAARMLGVRSALVSLIPWLAALGILLNGLGTLDAGVLLLLVVLCVPSFEAVRAVDGFVSTLQESLHSIDRLYVNHRTAPAVGDPLHPQAPEQTGEGLRVSNLGIHRAGQPVVEQLDFDLAPGQRVGLIGASGSGKSSVAHALLRTLPATGQVLLDGVDTAELAKHDVRERLVMVAQNDSLIRGSLRDNLLLGRANPGDEQLLSLLHELGLGSWLQTQRAGLDTKLGERGSRISGGQRQRVVLARALLRNPRILILDEATSALDTQTEAAVLAVVQRRVDAGMGLLMISHRLAVLENFDTVLVLDRGRIHERGPAATLLADESSLFSRMRQRELDSIEAVPLAGQPPRQLG